MKTAISIPDPIFAAAEKLARRLGISRSQLYSEAVDALIEKHRYSGVTEQLNAVYKANPEASRMEQEVEELQSRSVTEEDW
jgi:metal-responsive CopG/Arc/MetJ family transcriptional regulator